MDRYAKKRKVLRTQVTRLLNECNERLNQQLTSEDANVLHDRLTGLKVELNAVNNEIEPLVADQDSETEFTQVFEYNDRITTCLSRLAHRSRTGFPNQQSPAIASLNDNSTGATPRIRVRLPKLELMKFNGSVSQWQEFWEQFNQVVHQNNELTEVDKFNYLKTAVIGDAAAAIAGLPSTSRCYEDAVSLLKSRFGNQDLLVQTHLKRLIDIKPVRSAFDVRGLRCLHDTVISNIRGLETLGRQQETFSSMLFPIVQRALPKDLLLDFNRKLVMSEPDDSINPRNTPTATTAQPRESSHPSEQERTSPRQRTEDSFSKLINFLRLEIQSRENLAALQALDTDCEPRRKVADLKKNEDSEKARKSQASAALLNSSSKGDRCCICKSTRHAADNCDASTSLREKKDLLRTERRCFRCTKRNHQAKECRSNIKCLKCRGRHATSMCDPHYSPGKRANNDTATTSAPVNLEATTSNPERPIVFMQTATIWCAGEKEKFRIRALFDGGSQRTFITKKISRKLGCKLLGHERLTVGVFGGSSTEKEFQRVLVLLTTQSGKLHQLEVLETELICNQRIPVPSRHLNDKLKELNCSVGDLSNDEGLTAIDLLIGSEHFWELTTGRSRKLEGRLRAVESVFGWSVQGPVEGATQELPCYQTIALKTAVTESTTDILKKFWTLEAIGVYDFEKNSLEDDPVMNIFEETVTQVNGRYQVALPWKNMVDLEDNKGVAIKRLHQLIRKLRKTPGHLQAYDNVIRQYMIDDMAEHVATSDNENELPTYYMPHQVVVRESSSSTKLRVVFDASSHAYEAKSLNQNLESGPNLTSDLVSLLLNFRTHRIALVADIEKAFLQIEISETDRDALRFLWFETTPTASGSLPPIECWRMTRVPFGTTSSPFLLSATIQHHLKSVEHKYPETVKTLKESFYVDDLLTGADEEAAALKIYTEAKTIFSAASMKLHKWVSNNKHLKERFEQDYPNHTTHLGYLPGVLKVLGLTWNPDSDRLTFTTSHRLEDQEADTKRGIVRTTARLYDPLGWISPFTVRAKSLFQQLWKKKVDWDESIPDDMKEEWFQWCAELDELNKIQVPRFYGFLLKDRSENVALHIFADASTVAYGTVAYVCSVGFEDNSVSTIVMSKSRIAPVKPLTLARLELMACLLAARLYKYLTQSLHDAPAKTHLWTDSTIACHWVNGDATRWKPFVQNRVTEIQSLTNGIGWRHCPGKENPADLLTRGIKASRLVDEQLWWSGPEWIKGPEDYWPKLTTSTDVTEQDAEERRITEVIQTATFPTAALPVMDIKRFSSADRAFRVTAWILRYVNNLRRTERTSGPLSTKEINEAELYWLRQEQREHFSREIRSTQDNTRLPLDSPLRELLLFIDSDSLLRVKGRLQHSSKPYEERHPIVLPKAQQLSSLLAAQAHLRVLHGGVRDTLVQLKERYWIVGGRQLVKQTIRKCLTCQRFNARPAQQVTAPLPPDRVTRAPPFAITGVDFAGPLFVKSLGSDKKSYIALFTCAVTRAVHLEMVSDMSAKTFLLAFRRFISRRGVPQIIYSDNALSFKKASRDLTSLWAVIRAEEVQNFFGSARIEWKFIVERAPWWGGFYERLVGSTKKALKKTLGSSRLNAEELITTLTEIEAVLNSRPLTHVYVESGEPEALCPAFFLTGKRMTSLPNLRQQEIRDISCEHLRMLWKDRQRALDMFWSRWAKEYLNDLRSASNTRAYECKKIKEGDLVLLRETMIPRQLWKMGKVVQVFPGRDGNVRSCKLKLPGGNIVKRPIQLLYPLEMTQ